MPKANHIEFTYWILLIVVLLLFVIWEANWLGSPAWEFDEGINLMKAHLLAKGYPLYSAIWSDQPPLFTLLLAGAIHLAGQSVAAGRAMVLCFAVLGLSGVAILVRRISGSVAALGAVLLLITLPHFQKLSSVIMIGLPAISLGVLALAAGFHYRKRGDKRWLLVAGMLLGLSLLTKPIAAVLYPVLCLVILIPAHDSTPNLYQRFQAWGYLSLAMVLPLLGSLLLFAPCPFLAQVFGTYGRAREAAPFDLSENMRTIWAYLAHDKYGLSYYGLLILAGCGLTEVRQRRHWAQILPLVLWLGLAFLSLLLQTPLRNHHLLLVAFPLVTLAGVSFGQLIGWFQRPGQRDGVGWAVAIITMIGLVTAGIELIRIVPADWRPLTLGLSAEQEEEETLSGWKAIAFLQSHTPPGSVIITDDPMLAFQSDRRIPPQLAVPSARRLGTGDLSAGELIALSEENHPSAILFWEERLSKVPAYLQWVLDHYYLVRAYPDSRYIYLPFDSSMIAYPQSARVGEEVMFLGSQLGRFAVEAGDHISVTLYWRTEAPMQKSFTLFVHLIDSEGKRWGQVDRLPFEGHHATDQWLPGQVMADTFSVPVQPDAPVGEMLLAAGFYEPDTGERLPVTDESGSQVPGDQVYLKPQPVVRWEPGFDIPNRIQYPLRVDVGESVRLLGYDADWGSPLDAASLQAGQAISLALYWQARGEMTTSYTVFTHLLSHDGKLVAQQDQVPGAGKYPTTGWLPGEVIVDSYQIPVPGELPAGVYQLTAGMYDVRTGERLPAIACPGRRLPEDRVPLGEIEVRRD